jgi:hypothetical protein
MCRRYTVSDEASGYVLTAYFGCGLPPERTEYEDKLKAEKAFADAKTAAILWQSRSVANGLGWIKLKTKEAPIAPPPGAAAAPVAAKPAVVAAVPKPAAPVAVAAPAPVPVPAPASPAAPSAEKTAG